jgi:hypothetical protein
VSEYSELVRAIVEDTRTAVTENVPKRLAEVLDGQAPRLKPKDSLTEPTSDIEQVCFTTAYVAFAVIGLTVEDTVLRDAGVWRENTAYARGSVVSHSGTIWSCQRANAIDRPGAGDSWRLMVKAPLDERRERSQRR